MRFQLLYWPAKNSLVTDKGYGRQPPFQAAEQPGLFRLAAAGYQPLVGVRIDGRLAGCPALRTKPSAPYLPAYHLAVAGYPPHRSAD